MRKSNAAVLLALLLAFPVWLRAQTPGATILYDTRSPVVTFAVESLDAALKAQNLRVTRMDYRNGSGPPGARKEVVIDVYSYQEDVRVICYDHAGRELWKKKTRAKPANKSVDKSAELPEAS